MAAETRLRGALSLPTLEAVSLDAIFEFLQVDVHRNEAPLLSRSPEAAATILPAFGRCHITMSKVIIRGVARIITGGKEVEVTVDVNNVLYKSTDFTI